MIFLKHLRRAWWFILNPNSLKMEGIANSGGRLKKRLSITSSQFFYHSKAGLSTTLIFCLLDFYKHASKRETKRGSPKPSQHSDPFLFIPKPSVFSFYIDLFGIEKRLIGRLELLKFNSFRFLQNTAADHNDG